jgi:hypothetical protein
METDTEDEKDWLALNAMADGELDPAEQAALAGRLPRDARLVAGLRRVTPLKAALAEVGREGAPPMPDLPAPKPVHRISFGRIAAAAVLILALVLPLQRVTVPSAFEEALSSHRSFATRGAATETPSREISPAGLPRTGIVPDLADAGLVVRYVATEKIQGKEALHLGYHGSRGCRVSLWLRLGGGSFDASGTSRQTLAAAWTANDIAYLLLATGMPPDRFYDIAAAAERATHDAGDIPEDARLALRTGRAASQPCIG